MNDPITFFGQIKLYLKLSDLRAKAIFSVVKPLPFTILIWTYLMYNYVKTIYATKGRLKALRSETKSYPFARGLGQVGHSHRTGAARRGPPKQYLNLRKWTEEHRQVESRNEDLNQAQ